MMAELAPELTFEIYREQPVDLEVSQRYLKLVDQAMVDVATLTGFVDQNSWISADDLPSLRADRLRFDSESHEIIEDRMHLLREGRGDEVPYAFNTLTTAHKLLKAEEVHGVDSPEYAKYLKGLHLDTTRHIAEANRRLTYMYAPETEQVYDPELDSYVYGGYVLDEVVTDGLTPVGAEQVGIDVLIADRREELTAKSLGKLMLGQLGIERPRQPVTMLTVSQVENSPQIMVRGLRFDQARNSRFQEQVGFVKGLITHHDIVDVFKDKGVIDADAQPSEIDVLGIQAISLRGETPLNFMQSLDIVASKRTGKNIFMGEEVGAEHPKDYSVIPGEAAEREAQQEDQAKALMDELLSLARRGVDGWLANMLIDKFVTDMLLDKVSNDPAAARNIFGEKTARTIEQSMNLRRIGDISGANQVLDQARVEAPQATVCSGGSCGLESVDEKTRLATIKELGGKEGDTVLRDKVRSCPKCREKSLIYVFNDKEVRTKCQGTCKQQNLKKSA